MRRKTKIIAANHPFAAIIFFILATRKSCEKHLTHTNGKVKKEQNPTTFLPRLALLWALYFPQKNHAKKLVGHDFFMLRQLL